MKEQRLRNLSHLLKQRNPIVVTSIASVSFLYNFMRTYKYPHMFWNHSFSNHPQVDCFLNSQFRLTTNETPMIRVFISLLWAYIYIYIYIYIYTNSWVGVEMQYWEVHVPTSLFHGAYLLLKIWNWSILFTAMKLTDVVWGPLLITRKHYYYYDFRYFS